MDLYPHGLFIYKDITMAAKQTTTVVGVFKDYSKAQEAIRELKAAGFTDDQIGVLSRDHETRTAASGTDKGSYAGEGAAAGLATGAGLGALWGLGIVAGVLPAIGPAIAGGTLAAILSSAAAGAAAAGIAGSLVGLGIPKEEAEYYEGEFKSGRTLVTVHAAARCAEVRSLLRRFGATDISDRSTATAATSPRAHSVLAEVPPMGAAARPMSTTHTAEATTACPTPGAKASSGFTGAARSEQTGRVQAVEEELHVSKQPVETGEANIRKEVHHEHKTIEVPVEREEVVIERHPVSGRQPAAGIPEKQEIRIPVREEHVQVEKTPVVKEEVTVGKRKVQTTEKVDATLRKEEIKVEKEGQANVKNKR